MATRTEIQIQVQSRDHRDLPQTPATITKVKWDKSERMKNAFKTFGFVIAFAFASIFIPILHFVLVPVLLIASFVFAMDKMGEEYRNEGGTGECPMCHQVFKVQPSKWSAKEATRITNSCDHCPEELEMMIPIA